MNANEAARLAAAVAILRPDWPEPSLRTFLTDPSQLISQRPWQDAAVALVWCALDPETQTPKRVNGAGPWWLIGKRNETEPQRAIDCPACHDVHMPWVPCLREKPPEQEPEMSRREIKMHAWATRARAAVAEADKSALAQMDARILNGDDAEALAAEKARRHARARHVLDERRREESA